MHFTTLQNIVKENGFVLVALIDPDKKNDSKLDRILSKINNSSFDVIFIGGSQIEDNLLESRITFIKERTSLPLISFPGSANQISSNISTMLYLNLISGRNPKYLIEEQVRGALKINKLGIETIPTAYILLDSGSQTSVSAVSNTLPLSMDNKTSILSHALAGEYMGNKLLYFDCGSGAEASIKHQLLVYIKSNINLPIIVGGGVKSYKEALELSNSGASYIVIGNALENDKYIEN